MPRDARLHPSPVFGGLRDSKEHPLLVGYIYSMQNSITFMGPFIVQNSQQRSSRAGSAISLKANVRANVRRGPNTMKICGRVWGYSSHCLCASIRLLATYWLLQLCALQWLKIKRIHNGTHGEESLHWKPLQLEYRYLLAISCKYP